MRPNIVFILADDLGYADLGCYGARADVSPNLDRLARDGLRCLNSYSNSPVCSPTRFALMSGRYQYRFAGGAEEPLTFSREHRDPNLGFPPTHPSLPSLLRRQGYRTALIGKWHLGSPPGSGPLSCGYEEHFGTLGGGVDYFSHRTLGGPKDLWDNGRPATSEGYLTDLFSERACDYVERMANASAPFFLSLHYTAPHWPWQAREDRAESDRIGNRIQHTDGGSVETYQRMVRQMDEGIGRLIRTLERHVMLRNTLIVFTSDNGGERYSDSWPLIGGKMDLTEGGIRVPCIVHWPERVAAAGVSSQLVTTMDWTATLLEAAGAQADPQFPLDGMSMMRMLEDPAWNAPRWLFWQMKYRDQAAARYGNWKYLAIASHEYLFDLARDSRERANVRHRYPDRFEQLRQAFLDWQQTMPPRPPTASYSLVATDEDMPHWHRLDEDGH